MHHYVYEITNLVNGKVYVGKHSTECLDDGYMGSGFALNAAIQKHGIENFRKRIIESFDSAEAALFFEKLIVDDEFISSRKSYNLVVGGSGGWTKEACRKGALSACASRIAARKRLSELMSERNRRLLAEGKLNRPDWSGKKHSEESKKKIGEANAVHQLGSGNSQYGTVWVAHELEQVIRKIRRDELETYLSVGWIRGRKIPRK